MEAVIESAGGPAFDFRYEEALCATSDLPPRTWEAQGSWEDRTQAKAAIEVCNVCPIRELCLTDAFEEDRRAAEHGTLQTQWGPWIRGGLLARERLQLQGLQIKIAGGDNAKIGRLRKMA